MSSEFLQKAVASAADDGIYRGRTLEGLENYTAFARSARTGWTAHVALGSDYIERTRQFRRAYGITPGRWRALRKQAER